MQYNQTTLLRAIWTKCDKNTEKKGINFARERIKE